MGTPAHANVTALFDNQENANLAFQAFVKWAELAGQHQLPEPDQGDFCIENIKCDDIQVSFELDSMRDCNCEWQQERCFEWFKKQQGIQSFESNLMIMGDGIFWYLGDD